MIPVLVLRSMREDHSCFRVIPSLDSNRATHLSATGLLSFLSFAERLLQGKGEAGHQGPVDMQVDEPGSRCLDAFTQALSTLGSAEKMWRVVGHDRTTGQNHFNQHFRVDSGTIDKGKVGPFIVAQNKTSGSRRTASPRPAYDAACAQIVLDVEKLQELVCRPGRELDNLRSITVSPHGRVGLLFEVWRAGPAQPLEEQLRSPLPSGHVISDAVLRGRGREDILLSHPAVKAGKEALVMGKIRVRV